MKANETMSNRTTQLPLVFYCVIEYVLFTQINSILKAIKGRFDQRGWWCNCLFLPNLWKQVHITGKNYINSWKKKMLNKFKNMIFFYCDYWRFFSKDSIYKFGLACARGRMRGASIWMKLSTFVCLYMRLVRPISRPEKKSCEFPEFLEKKKIFPVSQ